MSGPASSTLEARAKTVAGMVCAAWRHVLMLMLMPRLLSLLPVHRPLAWLWCWWASARTARRTCATRRRRARRCGAGAAGQLFGAAAPAAVAAVAAGLLVCHVCFCCYRAVGVACLLPLLQGCCCGMFAADAERRCRCHHASFASPSNAFMLTHRLPCPASAPPVPQTRWALCRTARTCPRRPARRRCSRWAGGLDSRRRGCSDRFFADLWVERLDSRRCGCFDRFLADLRWAD